MKKSTLIWALGVLCVMALGLASCQKEEEFDETLLYGKWKSGTEYLRFDATYSDFTRHNGDVVQVNGAFWDTNDDVSESEAQSFTWTLEKSTLTIIHQGEMGSKSPRVYKILKLTSGTLSLKESSSGVVQDYTK